MTDPVFPLLSALVAQNSVSSTNPLLDQTNRGVCSLLADWLGDAGFDCRLEEVGRNKVNLIARRAADTGSDEGGLVLSGHADTVPCDPDHWQGDPWALRDLDGHWTGLGATDMKGFLALCVAVARDLRSTRLARPLTIVATADEESGMDGALALLRSGNRLGDFAVIGEPTGLAPVNAHKGIYFDALVVEGRAGHSSDPDAGRNALDGMHLALAELMRFRDELRARTRAPEFSVPFATLNPGCLHCGDSPNRIPSRARLEWDLRYPPSADGPALRAELLERMAAPLRAAGWVHHFENLADSAPFVTAADSPIVQAASRLSGRPPEAVNFATEGGYFNQLGTASIILGPGYIAQAHQPEEYLPAAHLKPMRQILDGLVQRFCLQPAARA